MHPAALAPQPAGVSRAAPASGPHPRRLCCSQIARARRGVERRPGQPRRAVQRRCLQSSGAPGPDEADARPAMRVPGEAPPLIARQLVDFINAAWTQFHAVEEASRRLAAAGFVKLSERDAWQLRSGGRYYFTRNASTLVAFAVGGRYQPGHGVHMIGAHTDSPCLKLKPISKGCKAGYQMVNVEPYGGGLWHTWFDRDLGLAGRVVVRQGTKLHHKLVKVDKPILRIPMLAIHLNRDIYEKGFKPNKQNELAPILATAVKAAADKTSESGKLVPQEANTDTVVSEPTGVTPADAKLKHVRAQEDQKHHPLLLQVLARHLQCQPGDIVDFELNLCDCQPGVIGGGDEEFIFTGRLDNLAMSYLALRALADGYGGESGTTALDQEPAVKAIALFDHEECGSASAQGAGGPVMRDAMTRITTALGEGAEGALQRAIQASFLVSADMAHAVHPNYADKHEPDHRPAFGRGLVIKHNVNQRYATNALSATVFREVARRRNIPTQEFCVRSDMACGSTIGPILASGLGCRTVDVGAPQLAMHSIREMCGCKDMDFAYRHFLAFFSDFSDVDGSLAVDNLPPPDYLAQIDDVPCNHLHA